MTFAETEFTNLVLPSKAKHEFICEPHFDAMYNHTNESRNCYDIYKIPRLNLPAFRHFNIDELIKLMKYNNVSFFNLTFYLKYKNKFENQLETIFLANFIFTRKNIQIYNKHLNNVLI